MMCETDSLQLSTDGEEADFATRSIDENTYTRVTPCKEQEANLIVAKRKARCKEIELQSWAIQKFGWSLREVTMPIGFHFRRRLQVCQASSNPLHSTASAYHRWNDGVGGISTASQGDAYSIHRRSSPSSRSKDASTTRF
jgi:hypothetical protein